LRAGSLAHHLEGRRLRPETKQEVRLHRDVRIENEVPVHPLRVRAHFLFGRKCAEPLGFVLVDTPGMDEDEERHAIATKEIERAAAAMALSAKMALEGAPDAVAQIGGD
jgi:hypothetical protein